MIASLLKKKTDKRLELIRLAKQAIVGGKDNADGLISNYLELYANSFEKLRLKVDNNVSEFPLQVIDSVNNFIPDRDQFIEIIRTIAQYRTAEVIKLKIHNFFETLLPYLHNPKNFKQAHEWDYDNYKFIVEELFLCCIAILIKYDRFDIFSTLVNKEYYFQIPDANHYNKLHNFTIFRNPIKSLEYQNPKHYKATFLKDRFPNSLIEFDDLQQVDFLLFLIDSQKTLTRLHPYQRWNPDTLIYRDFLNKEFEIFIRAKSKAYFNSIKSIFDVATKEELLPLFQGFKNNSLNSFRHGTVMLNPDFLVNYQELCTRL